MTDASAAMAGPGTSTIEDLVRTGLPLVQYAVSDLVGRLPRHVHRDDLVSAGMLGLAQAAKSWDATRGVTFECYARARVMGAVLDELRSRDWATRSVRADARRLHAASDEITARTGATPEPEQLSEAMGISVSDVTKLKDDIHRATVLHYDAVFADVGESPIGVALGDEPLDALLNREMVGYLRDAVVSLPERLRKVVVEYFFEERQMQDIADDLGVTESRVSQMRAEALVLLRAGLDAVLDAKAPSATLNGRAAKRTAAYIAEVAAASDFKLRVSADAPGVANRIAATA